MRSRGLAWILSALAPLWACGDRKTCAVDDDCDDDRACFDRTCLSRPTAPITLAVEVDPAAGSRFARRDHPFVTFGNTALPLAVDNLIDVAATIINPLATAADPASAVRVSAGAPSEIGGRPPPVAEIDAISRGPGQPYEVMVPLPERWLGRTAQLKVLPASPLDRVMAPATLPVTLAPIGVFVLPGPAETLVVEGIVQSNTAPGDPVAGHEARLLVRGLTLSNVARTDLDGKFVLRVQKAALPAAAGAPDTQVRVELRPLGPVPIVMRVPFPGREDANLGQLRFPPAPQPGTFVVPVADAASNAPVSGAVVSFSTRLEAATGGEASYVRTAVTGADGRATLALLPGTSAATRDYVVTVVPPAGSSAGSLCAPSYPVGPASAPGMPPRVGAALLLPARIVQRGRVLAAGGAPAAGVRVRAVRSSPLRSAAACSSDHDLSPSETTTDRAGAFALPVEPGDHRIEVEPGFATALPLHALASRTIETSPAPLDISLPEPVLIEGRVVSPAGDGLAGARIRVYTTSAAASLPGGALPAVALLGVALSSVDGSFRIALARPP